MHPLSIGKFLNYFTRCFNKPILGDFSPSTHYVKDGNPSLTCSSRAINICCCYYYIGWFRCFVSSAKIIFQDSYEWRRSLYCSQCVDKQKTGAHEDVYTLTCVRFKLLSKDVLFWMWDIYFLNTMLWCKSFTVQLEQPECYFAMFFCESPPCNACLSCP